MRLALLLIMAGCASSSQQVNGPDGRADWYAIKCRRTQGNCYQEAGEVCPSGYQVADSQGRVTPVVVANQGNVYAGTSFTGEMLIRCK